MVKVFRKYFRHFNCSKGLTLIETLVGITLFAIVGYGIFTVYVQAVKIWQEAEGRVIMVREAARFQEELKRDVGNGMEIEIRNGYGGLRNRARIRHRRFNREYWNEFFTMADGLLYKRGDFRVFKGRSRGYEQQAFGTHPILMESAVDIFVVRVRSLQYDAPLWAKRRVLQYSLELINKYGHTYRVSGWAKCDMPRL